jgi:hypothetical protein
MTPKIPELYNRYYIKKKDERLGLFKLISERFTIRSGLYPGSFIHITPSFIIPEMVYADMDKRCSNFFSDIKTAKYVQSKKSYTTEPVFRFHPVDFTRGIPEGKGSFDLLISFYAGFISKFCGKYLKKGGILIANNSHGDASLARLDKSFSCIGVIRRRGDNFKLIQEDIDSFFITKTGKPIDRKAVERSMRGVGFTKPVYAYIFKKLK